MALFDRIRGGLVRYRLGALFVVGGLVLATLSVQSASAGGPALTRLRIELSGTGEWQAVSFSDSFIGAHHVASQSPGSTVERSSNMVVLRGISGSALAATIDVLLETNSNAASFVVKLAKSNVGYAHTKLHRTNAGSTQILSASNHQTSGDCTVTAQVARSQFVGEGYNMPEVDSRRLVLAFYYPWFQYGSFDSGPWYDEPTTAYDTNVPAEIGKQLDLAKQHGVNGMVISWDDIGNHTQRFDNTMAGARVRGMVVTPLIELLRWKTSSGSFNASGIISAIKLALARSGDAAFLKVAGRPVIFVFGAYALGADLWKNIAASVAAAGHDPFYVGEPPDPSYGFDGSYLYNPNVYGYDGLLWNNAGRMRTLRYQAQLTPGVTQRLWAATVSPGQNLSYYTPLSPKHVDRKGGERYDLTWGAALSTAPEWVLITSWNEWYEATHIVPSKRFGYTAMQRTASWSAAFRNPTGGTGSGSGGGGLLPDIKIPLTFKGVAAK